MNEYEKKENENWLSYFFILAYISFWLEKFNGKRVEGKWLCLILTVVINIFTITNLTFQFCLDPSFFCILLHI